MQIAFILPQFQKATLWNSEVKAFRQEFSASNNFLLSLQKLSISTPLANNKKFIFSKNDDSFDQIFFISWMLLSKMPFQFFGVERERKREVEKLSIVSNWESNSLHSTGFEWDAEQSCPEYLWQKFNGKYQKSDDIEMLNE